MNKRMNIVSAIKTAMKPLPWLYKCSECGEEWASGGYPRTWFCCGEPQEAKDNPDYVRQPASLTSTANSTATTGDQRPAFVSKMLLTKIEAE
jgi:hypothetical protein